MLNIHDLERRWLSYKIKSYLPLFFVSLGLGIAVIALLIYFPFDTDSVIDDKKPQVIAQETTAPQIELSQKAMEAVNEEIVAEIPQNTQYTHSDEPKRLVLKPSLSFMDNIENTLDPYLNDNISHQQSDELSGNSEAYVEPTVEKVVEKPKTQSTPKESRGSSVLITRKDSNSDLKDVIRRFKKNKNPALSLFIAKRYYAMGEYQKSYNYALMTNEIDKTIEESWIIFSKSLVKLGQHELAMVTLKSYLKTRKSTAAQVLLGKIQSGEFR